MICNILIVRSIGARVKLRSRVKVCVHNQSLAGGWRGPGVTNSGGRGERRLQPGHYNSINKCKLSVILLINYIFIMQLKLRPEFPVNKVSLLSICFIDILLRASQNPFEVNIVWKILKTSFPNPPLRCTKEISERHDSISTVCWSVLLLENP